MARKYLKTYKCRFCSGTGNKKCDICKGTGVKSRKDKLFHSCKACDGMGEIICTVCKRGRTYIEAYAMKE